MNTPKQILLYKAFESPLPVFGHVPMVLGADRTRLSKRHGAMSVTAYRDMGYLPEALINYLVRLGWSYGDQEFFMRGELIEKFTLENIGKSAGIFNPEKLLALNAEHIRHAAPERLIPQLIPFLKNIGCHAEPGLFLEKVIGTLKLRSKTLVEMAEGAEFYYAENVVYDENAAKKFLNSDAINALQGLAAQLAALDDFNEADLQAAYEKVMEATGLKLGKIAQPVRVALTGKTVSPGIFEIIDALGKDRVIARLQQAISYIKEHGA